MKITKHAAERLAQRRIALDWVVATLTDPEWTEPDPSQDGVIRCFRRIPELDGQILRVVAAMSGATPRVITAFPDRDARPPESER